METFDAVAQLEEELSQPSPELVAEVRAWDDGLLVLGAGGKMGPTLCRMAARALKEAGLTRDVIAVSRFTAPGERERLEAAGVTTIKADLLDRDALRALPSCRNVVFAAGRKFGSSGAESMTWAMNTYLPGIVAERFADARIAVFSSGNVYPFVSPASGGCTEETPPSPVGEYAQSVLGRERLFEHFSLTHGTPISIIRLNYAVELRYGVLVDLALKIVAGEPIDVTMGYFNAIWQRDANEYVLRSLGQASSPPFVLNVTGPETVSVRWAARALADALGREVHFVGEEAPDALLNNASRCFGLFGYPKTSMMQMIERIARWVGAGGPTHGKPTGFQNRDGKF